MKGNYYIKNIFFGIFFFAGIAWYWYHDPQNPALQYLMIAGGLSCLLYPFSKRAIEILVLKLAPAESWKSGWFTETPAKNGLYAFYYAFCFAVAIPVGLIFISYLLFKNKKAA